MLKKILVTLAALFAAVAFAATDVNKATQAELEAVKGIGPAIAGKILDERKKGSFKDWTDFIDRVKGVGEGNAAKLSADGLTVGGAAFKGAAPAAKAEAKPADKPMAAAAPAAKAADKPAAAAAPVAAKDAKPAMKEEKPMSAKEAKAAKAKEAKEAKEAKAKEAKDAKEAKAKEAKATKDAKADKKAAAKADAAASAAKK